MTRFAIEDDAAFKVVGEAGDGRSALDGITAKRPEAVLLDLSMPDMDGFEAAVSARRGCRASSGTRERGTQDSNLVLPVLETGGQPVDLVPPAFGS